MMYLFNTNIVPSEAVVRVSSITAEQAKSLIQGQTLTSAIGHEATASAMGKVLNVPVEVSRIFAQPENGDRAISLKVNGRLPEGVTLDEKALNEIGYTLYLMEFYDPAHTIHAFNHNGDGK